MLTMEDYFSDNSNQNAMMKHGLIADITTNNNKTTKARELLLNGDIEAADFKAIKVKAEESIVRLEAKLPEQLGKESEESEIQRIYIKQPKI